MIRSRVSKLSPAQEMIMRRVTLLFAALVTVSAGWAQAQQVPSPNMSFFVTSTGLGKGGDLGGLDGADRHCQELAQATGAGSKTWHAYLSTQPANGVPAVMLSTGLALVLGIMRRGWRSPPTQTNCWAITSIKSTRLRL